MEIIPLTVGPLEVNCYVVYDAAAGMALVIDPGDDAERIIEILEDRGLQPGGILLTHAHVDHIRGVGAVARRFGVPVELHPADRALYFSPENALPPWIEAATDLPEPAPVPRRVSGLNWELIETPGHSPGSVSFFFPDAGVVFSGDTLFAGGVGRTDFPGGDWDCLQASIRHRLYALPPLTRILPGHGPATTVEQEMQANPFVRRLDCRL
ncbi:MAG: MBL fold metallo-hydrolase [Kiritimatiellaeota bacterium]|nr:MBL fold metallo-hydrolase [Kiritimatiellota bacterium]